MIGFNKNFVSFTVYATALSGALNKFITFTVRFLVLLFTLKLQSIPVIPKLVIYISANYTKTTYTCFLSTTPK